MASNQLTAVSGTGEQQATTQSPQTAGQAGTTGTLSSSVQPGTATTLLNGQGSVALHPTALSTVNLAPVDAAATASVSTPSAVLPKHHVNPALFGFSALFLVVAVVLFWTTNRSLKNTTKY